MKVRRTLRLISLVMLIVAVVFVFCALSNPALGKVIYFARGDRKNTGACTDKKKEGVFIPRNM